MNRRTLLRFGALALAAPRSVVVPPEAVPALCDRCLTVLNERRACCLCDGCCDECWLDAPLTELEKEALDMAEWEHAMLHAGE